MTLEQPQLGNRAAASAPGQGKWSVRYLRVSDPRQMETDAHITAEGNSIDTQRKETVAKEAAMGLVNVGEYVEPGTSAQSIEKRKVFKEMLRRIVEEGDVDCVVIYMRSRVFRNAFDAAITKRQLLKLGVRLISAKEDFGEGIMADAMEAITDIFNEVQVRLNGQDIKVKMRNKALNGGTVSRTKVGYLNVRKRLDGKEVRTVELDPERAPYLRMAFEEFATGRYTAELLQEKLTDAGLYLPPTAKWPRRPISVNTLLSALRDRYYLGEVKVDGVWMPGRHEALVTPETFDRAQRVLDSHSGAGTRKRKHHHYLKGTVWCGRCGKRFIIQPGRGNGGTYFYFMCRGRQDKTCEQPYIPVEVMEQAVADHYKSAVVVPPEFIATVRAAVHEAAAADSTMSQEEREQLERRLGAIGRKESYFLDLAAEEDWPKEALKEKLLALRSEKQGILRTIQQAERRLATGRDLLDRALDLLERPHELYETSSEEVRTILNRAFFRKLYVDGERVTDRDLQEPFDVLYGLYEVQREAGRADATRWGSHAPDASETPEPTRAGLSKETGSDDLDSLIHRLGRDLVHGSSKQTMVGDTGIEPVTSSVSGWFRSSLDLRVFEMPQVKPGRSVRLTSVRDGSGNLRAPVAPRYDREHRELPE